ncbi:hypothetical protein [Campylobacter sp. MG1]|uniref:hypothetical protein n=1 Tax=Campylobacter sp. MG1 TaxID=2976332 RepID=UPI00226CF0B4|nr:hypothetical protein [Campylobacter sp. MG1]
MIFCRHRCNISHAKDYHKAIACLCRFYHSSIAMIENLPYDDFIRYYKNMQNTVNNTGK